MQGIGFDFPKQIQTKSSVLGSYIYIYHIGVFCPKTRAL